MADRIDRYVEVATKRAFAGALGWPGWYRAGRSEEAAAGCRDLRPPGRLGRARPRVGDRGPRGV